VSTDIDPRLFDALASLNQIGAAINRIGSGDTAGVEATLRLIVESATKVVPGASAVIYTFDPEQQGFDPASRVSAGELSAPVPGDEPRPNGMGIRAITQHRRVLSYEEPDLDIHHVKARAGAKVVACFPLVVAEQPLGVLYVYRYEEKPFSRLELLMLENFVNQAAIGIYHARQRTGMQRELARKEEELARLRRAGLLISSRLRLEETLEAILQMALEVTGARYGIFRLVDRGGQNLVTRAIAGERLGRPAVETLPINATSITGWVAKFRRPLCIRDVRALPWARIYYPLDYDLVMRSELAVPLIGANGRLEGVLNLESPMVGAFTEEDSLLLQSLATQAVIAIQEVRLLDALQEIARCLLTEPQAHVFDRLVEMASDLLNASASAIWVLEGEHLTLQAASAGHLRGDRLLLRESLTGQAILTRGPVESEDVRVDPRFSRQDLAQVQGWMRALIVPLLAGDDVEPVGAFSVYGPVSEGAGFAQSDWDKKVLTILAHYAALAVHNAARQEALRVAQEQRAVAETFAAVGDVAANLLHRLNNKVGTIPVRVEGIQDKCQAALEADAYLATNLAEIERSAVEAMAAVRESLSFLRPLNVAPLSVEACVRAALASVNLTPGIAVEMEGLSQLPPVQAGEHGLTLVFVNLLENAVEAMGERGHIMIRGTAEGPWVRVSVQDSGPGIPPELHDQIFEFSFSRRTSGRRGKLGFGLWWVKTIITRLGGTIWVESDGQHGTTFWLQVPRAEEEG